MSFTKSITYKGLALNDVLFSVERCTLQDGQLDFFIAMRAGEGLPLIDGQTHGCPYDSTGDTPESQAQAYAMTLDNPLEVPYEPIYTPSREEE